MNRNRIGILGGTFDPIHNGHLHIATEALLALSLESVVFIPNGKPAHKDSSRVSFSEDRWQMTQLAIESNGAFSASRIEIDRIGKSYTVETLRELTAANPETDYYFIVGMDSVPEIPSWYCWQEIVQLTRFAVLQRPGYDYETLKLTTPLELLSKITFIPTEPLDISATNIRRLVSEGKRIDHLVPTSVSEYISAHRLYL